MLLDIRISPRVVQVRDRRVAERKRPVKTGPDHIWTRLEITHVMALVEQGRSRGQIASVMGCTRNAICGLVYKERRRQAKRLAEAQGRAA